MIDSCPSIKILRGIFRPSFFIDDESPYDIYDDFPESLGDVREEEIAILLPFLMRRILAVTE
jgi:hypothetical protein